MIEHPNNHIQSTIIPHIFFVILEACPQCSFPEFLWDDAKHGTRIWITHSRYKGNKQQLESHHEVAVEETLMTTTLIKQSSECLDYEGEDPDRCQKNQVYNI